MLLACVRYAKSQTQFLERSFSTSLPSSFSFYRDEPGVCPFFFFLFLFSLDLRILPPRRPSSSLPPCSARAPSILLFDEHHTAVDKRARASFDDDLLSHFYPFLPFSTTAGPHLDTESHSTFLSCHRGIAGTMRISNLLSWGLAAVGAWAADVDDDIKSIGVCCFLRELVKLHWASFVCAHG